MPPRVAVLRGLGQLTAITMHEIIVCNNLLLSQIE